ncbi:hypothetical protein VNI00_003682 [Paramarasmius palmivorus]|uniref:DUF4203 domain-containing protein n=1 Tax=Paramarasmius palmivorus TaxID=297713 RepID=A0AAW0DPN2_9AGAR
MATINTNTTLLDLLPTSSYLLAYSLPLLFLSLILTFSGSFFTLDRTRQFRPSYDAAESGGVKAGKWKRSYLLLEGGIGGLMMGYVFGLHLSTFLALLIPSTTSSKPLSNKSFVAVWLLSALVTTFLGGRFKYAALTFAALLGGTGFSLFLAVILHPALLTRQIFVAIILPILLLFTLLPLVRTQHGALRFSASSAGAFGVIVSIALMCRITSWGDIWSRLWVEFPEVGDGKERGLSAGYALFLIFGVVCDFMLNKVFGECPDEKWDSYLAKYTSNLPDREGTFKPFVSVWERLTTATPAAAQHHPLDEHPDQKDPLAHFSPAKLSKYQSRDHLPRYDELSIPSSRGQLKKGRTSTRTRQHNSRTRNRREAVKFRSAEEGLSSDSDEDTNELLANPNQKPWLRQTPSSASNNTLVGVDYDKEIKALKERKVKGMGEGEIPDYSDYESDIAEGGGKGRPPSALAEYARRESTSSIPSYGRRDSDATKVDPGSQIQKDQMNVGMPVPVPVPATPSLIRALDRVALAYSQPQPQQPLSPLSSSLHSGLPQLPEEEEKEREKKERNWDAFWKDVRHKSESTSGNDLR